MRYASKVDANQGEIVEALRAVGAKVLPIHRVGQGCPDLLCGYRDNLYLMEVKTKKGKLNKLEAKFFREWAGYVWIVRSPESALRLIGAVK